MSITNDIIKEINVDVYDRKIIIVNAKQYDSLARYILVTCYNQGVVFPINYSLQYAYVRMKKPDGKCVFNDCKITTDGKVKIELTEQMLASSGNAIIELVILDKDNTMDVFANTGNLTINNQKIFSTMTFYINIVDSACNCWDIESSDEFNALNSLMIQATKNYNDVMTAAKVSEENAKAYKDAAKVSEQNASMSENAAKVSEQNASMSENAAKVSEQNASMSEQNANNSKLLAEEHAILAKSYTIGDTGTRTGEDSDNAKYYYNELVKLDAFANAQWATEAEVKEYLGIEE